MACTVSIGCVLWVTSGAASIWHDKTDDETHCPMVPYAVSLLADGQNLGSLWAQAFTQRGGEVAPFPTEPYRFHRILCSRSTSMSLHHRPSAHGYYCTSWVLSEPVVDVDGNFGGCVEWSRRWFTPPGERSLRGLCLATCVHVCKTSQTDIDELHCSCLVVACWMHALCLEKTGWVSCSMTMGVFSRVGLLVGTWHPVAQGSWLGCFCSPKACETLVIGTKVNDLLIAPPCVCVCHAAIDCSADVSTVWCLDHCLWTLAWWVPTILWCLMMYFDPANLHRPAVSHCQAKRQLTFTCYSLLLDFVLELVLAVQPSKMHNFRSSSEDLAVSVCHSLFTRQGTTARCGLSTSCYPWCDIFPRIWPVHCS